MAMCKRFGFIAGLMLAMITGQVVAAPPTEQQVRKLMDVIGMARSLSQMNEQVGSSMKQALPCVSPNYWKDFIDQNGSQEYIGRLVPIYQKHFTADEVDGMVKFYGSPLGQKVLTEMPLAMAEANQAGLQWTHEHGQQMIAKLEQAGTLGADGRCPATGTDGKAMIPAPASSTAAYGEDDEDAPAPAASAHAAPKHATSSRKHTSTKKHAPAKKGASGKKAAPAKKTTPVKKKPKAPAATAPAQPSASQGGQ